MATAHEQNKAVGVAIAVAWTPEDLARKFELEQQLIAQGYAGMDLERKAIKMLKGYGIRAVRVSKPASNTFVNGGTNLILTAVISGGTTLYSNANAALGVGDSSAAFALTQTNLQGAVNVTDRIRKAMDATFPSIAANVATFRSTFGTGDANFIWNEWAFFNNVTDGSGTMLNRSVANLGTKTSATSWQLLATWTQN